MGMVGGVLAHRMVSISGWKDVQLPTVLSATLTHSLGTQEVMGAMEFLLVEGLRRGWRLSTYQGNEIDDGQRNQHTDQHQQGNAPARYPRPRLGRGRK